MHVPPTLPKSHSGNACYPSTQRLPPTPTITTNNYYNVNKANSADEQSLINHYNRH